MTTAGARITPKKTASNGDEVREFTVKITRSGQITLPAEVRKFLGVKAGDEVDYRIADDGSVTIVAAEETLASLSGILPPPYPGFDLDKAIEMAKEEMAHNALLRS